VLALAVVAAATSGCVDRRFVVETDPPGAIVYVNGYRVGATPCDVPFTYYGTYHFEFQRDGYQTLVVDECVKTPWYEWFPLEFFSENLLPYTVRDIHTIRKQLEPLQILSPQEIKVRADQLRAQGQALGVALPAAPPPVPGVEAGPPPQPLVPPGPVPAPK
jgi:hypothetical protein